MRVQDADSFGRPDASLRKESDMSHLVLTRAPHEQIRLFLPDGDQITVEVIRLGRGTVRLGVVAPERVKIWRQELVAGLPARAAKCDSVPLTEGSSPCEHRALMTG
jgi:carbon storage regulator CsrA